MKLETMEVGEAAAYIPGATKLFRQYNIEFCCRGNQPLNGFLEKNPDLKDALVNLMESGKNEPMISREDFPTIINYILQNYHNKHRADLTELVLLAERVEMRHEGHSAAPKGLATHLKLMLDELSLHMSKEEIVLFPILLSNPYAKPSAPIQAMMGEHIEHGVAIERIYTLTNGLKLPADACTSWRALYANLDYFIQELREHIHLENNALFKRALQEEKEA